MNTKSKWVQFSLDTNFYAGLIRNEDEWKKCKEELREIKKLEDVMGSELQIPSPGIVIPRFGFPINKGYTLEMFFEENNMKIDSQ